MGLYQELSQFIIDEKKRRAVAETFGLKTIGLIDILYLFKQKIYYLVMILLAL